MFIIKWRMVEKPASVGFYARWFYGWRFVVRVGLSRYASREAAQQQVDIWQRYFPRNRYYIEPLMS